ncbi:tetratricopeptide repeat protein [Kitasatospora sp. NPDC004745]|uniref:tetratricopeptide repeat protein n=1 Tax=Kitasatospora sp. NPDC004745 TaxID=3364019 RepID=UPI0036B1A3C7
MSAEAAPGVHNEIRDGVFLNTVVQGRHVNLRLPREIDRALSGLPPCSSTFTGRDAELATLLAGLAPGAAGQSPRVQVVAGLAGIGKTELAVQTAHAALREESWFPGGALFVDLLGYDPDHRLSPDHALDGWLRALGIPAEHIPPGVQDRSRLFRSALAALARAGRPVLLVIDNAAGYDQVRPLLPGDGVTAALVTSRDGLAVDARLHDLTALGPRASVDLLDHALREARGGGDTRVSDAPEDAATVVRLCAGLPLALRIAGALLADSPGRPLSSLARALEADHTRLRRLHYEDFAVRAAFDLSYRRLDATHARLFRLLSLNPGPDLATEAAAALAGVDDVEAEELLCDLSRAHLVEQAGGWGRWRMHDLVRLYAGEQGNLPAHAAADHRDTAQDRLHEHFTATLRAANTHLAALLDPPSPRFADLAAALAWLDAERPNLIALVTAAPPLGRPRATTSLALNLSHFLSRRRHLDDLLDVTAAALRTFRERGDHAGEAGALNNLGVTLRKKRRFEEAIDAHTRVVALRRRLGDRSGEAVALVNLGVALRDVRRFEQSIDVQTRAAAIFAELHDRHGEAKALNNLSLALREARRFEEAIEVLSRIGTVFRDLHDLESQASLLNNLGAAHTAVHRFEEAIAAHDRAAATYAELHDRHREAMTLATLSEALVKVGKLEEAIDLLTWAGTVFRDLHDPHSQASTLNNLGIALRKARRFDEAIAAHTRAAATYAELHDHHRRGGALNNLGLAQSRAGRFDEALDSLSRAATIFRELDDRHNEARALANRAQAAERGQAPPD